MDNFKKILEWVADLPDFNKFVLIKDPNQNKLKFYAVPEDLFAEDGNEEDEESDNDSDQDSDNDSDANDSDEGEDEEDGEGKSSTAN